MKKFDYRISPAKRIVAMTLSVVLFVLLMFAAGGLAGNSADDSPKLLGDSGGSSSSLGDSSEKDVSAGDSGETKEPDKPDMSLGTSLGMSSLVMPLGTRALGGTVEVKTFAELKAAIEVQKADRIEIKTDNIVIEDTIFASHSFEIFGGNKDVGTTGGRYTIFQKGSNGSGESYRYGINLTKPNLNIKVEKLQIKSGNEFGFINDYSDAPGFGGAYNSTVEYLDVIFHGPQMLYLVHNGTGILSRDTNVTIQAAKDAKIAGTTDPAQEFGEVSHVRMEGSPRIYISETDPSQTHYPFTMRNLYPEGVAAGEADTSIVLTGYDTDDPMKAFPNSIIDNPFHALFAVETGQTLDLTFRRDGDYINSFFELNSVHGWCAPGTSIRNLTAGIGEGDIARIYMITLDSRDKTGAIAPLRVTGKMDIRENATFAVSHNSDKSINVLDATGPIEITNPNLVFFYGGNKTPNTDVTLTANTFNIWENPTLSSFREVEPLLKNGDSGIFSSQTPIEIDGSHEFNVFAASDAKAIAIGKFVTVVDNEPLDAETHTITGPTPGLVDKDYIRVLATYIPAGATDPRTVEASFEPDYLWYNYKIVLEENPVAGNPVIQSGTYVEVKGFHMYMILSNITPKNEQPQIGMWATNKQLISSGDPVLKEVDSLLYGEDNIPGRAAVYPIVQDFTLVVEDPRPAGQDWHVMLKATDLEAKNMQGQVVATIPKSHLVYMDNGVPKALDAPQVVATGQSDPNNLEQTVTWQAGTKENSVVLDVGSTVLVGDYQGELHWTLYTELP